MTSLPHIPAIRRGRNYESLDKASVIDHRTGKELVSISQVNAGIIRKDLAKIDDARSVAAADGDAWSVSRSGGCRTLGLVAEWGRWVRPQELEASCFCQISVSR